MYLADVLSLASLWMFLTGLEQIKVKQLRAAVQQIYMKTPEEVLNNWHPFPSIKTW